MSGAEMQTIPDTLAGRWRDLGDRAIFRFTGPDRVRYLNGQLTNQIDGPPERRVVPACLCTVKGKVEALVWVRADGDSLLLDGESRQRSALEARLEKYLIADDCEIEEVTGLYRILHHFRGETADGVEARRTRFPGRDLVLPRGAPSPFPEADHIPDPEWECEEILARIPASGREIDGETFPAELGLDRWAVDFHKGCYLGQEVVSRIRSVGKVKRSLRVVVAGRPLVQGEEISLPSGERGRVTRPSVVDREGMPTSLALFMLPIPGGETEILALPAG